MRPAVKILQERVDYDGSQLSSLFAYRTAGLVGDSAVAFLGACRVGPEHMVDQEDLLAGASIVSPLMLHVIAEDFGEPLQAMVLRQRLFGRLCADLLEARCGRRVLVEGDDLFVENRKASISVATASPMSALFHFGLNVRTEGVPVPAIGLEELGVEWRPFAGELLDAWAAECEDVARAAAKVRWVR